MSVDEQAFEALKSEIEAWVRGPGEEYAAEIERTHEVPARLREELRDRGYLSLAAPQEYGGRGIQFSRYLELIELFSMSHASVRMIVHVANGVWRAIDQFATDEQRKQFVLPQVSGESNVAFTLTEPTAGTGADLRCTVRREGDTWSVARLVKSQAAEADREGPGSPLTIGEDCTIGHHAILHGCTVGDCTLIGMGATVLNRARIGRCAIVGANALVTEGTEFPDYSLIVGSPAKVVRVLDASIEADLRRSAAHYVANWQRFASGLRVVA